MMKKQFTRFLSLIVLLAINMAVSAQVTTGTITGSVKTSDGKNLEGAAITATLLSTGSVYKTVSKASGQYTLPNLRVGGPYELVIKYVGFNDDTYKDLYVTLGSPLVIDAVLSNKSQSLAEVTVSSGKGIISSQKNGTSTYLSSRLIQSVPSVNRNIQDYARLTPQAKVGSTASNGNGVGVSFGGQNNRYNQFSIDGANASDAFGLSASGTNGAQANINPISIEAIEAIQIVLSPYDVVQGGFVGGGINAVTKSGTNALHGSLYGQSQPKDLIGKSVSYNDGVTRNPIYGDYKNYTYGASLGGALIKNKLFFYLNAEHFDKATPLAFDPTVAGSGSKVSISALDSLSNFLKSKGYDPGTYGAISIKNASTSVFGRLDWNINDKNKLVFRFNHVEGYLDNLSRGSTTGVFANSGYRFNSKTNSAVLELNSSFSSKASNVLRLTYSMVRDSRSTSLFPNVSITNFNPAQSTNISYSLGSEFSSAVNGLNQDVFTLTDNFTLYKGKHTFTFGTNNEFFKSQNFFLQGFYGSYAYGTTTANPNPTNNILNFYNNTGMTSYGAINFALNSDGTVNRAGKAPAELKAAQFSVYGQDVWTPNSFFKLTYGLRIDLPVFFGTPDANTAFNAATAFAPYNVATNQMPKTQPLFSPRIGFNWDVEKNGELQIRGGAGLFTGRVPFVWISNNFSMTGVKSSGYSATSPAAINAAGITFKYDPTDPHLGAYIPAAGNATPVINVVDKNFKFPQVFRANIAADKKLGFWGLVSTFELVYTKTLNNANYTNINISQGGDAVVNIGPTQRPYWNKYQNTSYQQVLDLSNTNKGYAFTATAQIQKPLSHGWAGSIAYTYGGSTSTNDLTSSVALSNWQSPLNVNGLNNTELSTSNFNLGSRVVGYISKEFKYAKHFATSFTLIYTGQTGQGYSYTYGNNILGDNAIGSTSGAKALVYVPKNATEANFVDIKSGSTITVSAAQQWLDFQTFASNDEYLSKTSGQNTKRNGARMPFENHFDFRIAQDFSLGKQKLQVFFDVINIANLINKDWGWSYSAISTTADGFFTAASNLFSVVSSGSQTQNGVAITPTAANPAFQFNINNFTKINGVYRPYQVSDYTSRWSSQIGVRYSF